MLILGLDTTTRAGSLTLLGDDQVIETFSGDPERTHATRLPGDILECLSRHGLALVDIDLYSVAVGPGSFTGLRIGIATIQGLAFAHGRQVVGVSALDALAEAAGPPPVESDSAGVRRAACMDAQRGEVYGRLYRPAGREWEAVDKAVVAAPLTALAGWARPGEGPRLELVGDGALAYAAAFESALGARLRVIAPVPALSPAVAVLAARAARAGLAVPPGGVRPLYVRRPDAELARERREKQAR